MKISRIIVGIFCFSLLVNSPLMGQGMDKEFEKTLQGLLRFSVPLIPATDLKEALISAQPPFLLDIRSTQEFAVSHLPTARLVPYDNFRAQDFDKLPRDLPIVVYCSVGYRSERAGEQLQKMGFTQVKNLYGGIFEWSNLGLPLLGPDNKPTQRVHGYSPDWGRWVKKGKVVYAP